MVRFGIHLVIVLKYRNSVRKRIHKPKTQTTGEPETLMTEGAKGYSSLGICQEQTTVNSGEISDTTTLQGENNQPETTGKPETLETEGTKGYSSLGICQEQTTVNSGEISDTTTLQGENNQPKTTGKPETLETEGAKGYSSLGICQEQTTVNSGKVSDTSALQGANPSARNFCGSSSSSETHVEKQFWASETHTTEEIVKTSEAQTNSTPGAPESVEVTCSSITLQWQCENAKTDYYEIKYRECNEIKWKTVTTEALETQFQVNNLNDNTKYVFKVKCCYEDADSPFSSVSVPIKTKDSPANKVKSFCTQISNSIDTETTMPIYRLPMEIVHRDQENKIRVCEVGPKSQIFKNSARTILIAGASGAGKTLLLEAFANHLYGVRYDDGFRLSMKYLDDNEIAKSSNQSKSQTEWITKYVIARDDFNSSFDINIVDTPGCCATEGVMSDQDNADRISKFFKSDYIESVNAVCFVIPSSHVRLTEAQKYAWQSVLSLFGNDIKENIFLFFTFSDEGIPPALTSVKQENILFNTSYNFNNKSVFLKKDGSLSNWKMGNESMTRFFNDLHDAPNKSLALSINVMDKRQELEVIVQGMQPQISKAFKELELLGQELHIYETKREQLGANEHFVYDVFEPETIEIQTPYRSTICLECKSTCHLYCYRHPRIVRRLCFAMSGGKCRICDGHCPAQAHELSFSKFITQSIKTQKTSDELKKKYQNIQQIKNNIRKSWEAIGDMMKQIGNCTKELKKIALRNTPLTNSRYFDFLIEMEKRETNVGQEGRMSILVELKKNAQLIEACENEDFGGWERIDVEALLAKFINETDVNTFKWMINTVSSCIQRR